MFNYAQLSIACKIFEKFPFFIWASAREGEEWEKKNAGYIYLTSRLAPHRCLPVNSDVILCHAINMSQSNFTWNPLGLLEGSKAAKRNATGLRLIFLRIMLNRLFSLLPPLALAPQKECLIVGYPFFRKCTFCVLSGIFQLRNKFVLLKLTA